MYLALQGRRCYVLIAEYNAVDPWINCSETLNQGRTRLSGCNLPSRQLPGSPNAALLRAIESGH